MWGVGCSTRPNGAHNSHPAQRQSALYRLTERYNCIDPVLVSQELIHGYRNGSSACVCFYPAYLHPPSVPSVAMQVGHGEAFGAPGNLLRLAQLLSVLIRPLSC